MTVRELIEILEMFDEDADVLVFNQEYATLDNVFDVADNNGSPQLNVY